MRGWKKILHANGNQKKVGLAILVSDKIDFKIKTITRDKDGHYVTIKGSIQEDITTVNIYAPNTGAPQYIRQMLTTIKGEIDSNYKSTVTTNYCNYYNNSRGLHTPFSPMDRSSKMKIRKHSFK